MCMKIEAFRKSKHQIPVVAKTSTRRELASWSKSIRSLSIRCRRKDPQYSKVWEVIAIWQWTCTIVSMHMWTGNICTYPCSWRNLLYLMVLKEGWLIISRWKWFFIIGGLGSSIMVMSPSSGFWDPSCSITLFTMLAIWVRLAAITARSGAWFLFGDVGADMKRSGMLFNEWLKLSRMSWREEDWMRLRGYRIGRMCSCIIVCSKHRMRFGTSLQ